MCAKQSNPLPKLQLTRMKLGQDGKRRKREEETKREATGLSGRTRFTGLKLGWWRRAGDAVRYL